MTHTALSSHLPTLLAAVRQERWSGELVLEQNDGTRRLYWRAGELVYLQSDVAGEQFGNYLLRRGVLDFPVLSHLLATEDRYRLGEKVVQFGLMSLEERDQHLRLLQEQVMINALEHPIIHQGWNAGPLHVKLSDDLQLKLDHRHFIWKTFLEAHTVAPTLEILTTQTAWKWEGIPDLLDTLADLPLTPATAYAISFLGSEPVSFETFLSLADLSEDEAARIILILWAVGGLTLVQGDLPALGAIPAEPTPPPQVSTPTQAPTPAPELPPEPAPRYKVDPSASTIRPEFLDPDPLPAAAAAEPEPEPESTPGLRPPSPHEKAQRLYLQAKKLQRQEHTGEAIHCLEQAIQLDPESDASYAIWLLLGRLRMTNPAWSTRAVNAFQSAAQLRPKAAEPWVTMGLVFYRKGFRANAVACFHKALQLDPSVPIPEEVDYRELEREMPEEPPVQPASLFQRFKSILGGPDKG